MKKVWIIILMSGLFSMPTLLLAERAVLEGDSLIILKKVREIPDVPVGVSAEQAPDLADLVSGKLGEVRIPDKEGEVTRMFGWPIKKLSSEKVISFNQGWRVKSEKVISSDWSLTLLCVTPLAGILIITFRNQMVGVGDRKLFVFYCAMIASVIACAIMGTLAGTNSVAGANAGGGAGIVVGAIIVGAIAGVLTGNFAGGISLVCDFAGTLTGAFASMIAGWIAGEQGGYEIIWPYIVFLILAMIVSYIVAKFVRIVIKNYFPAIKKEAG